MAYFCHALLSLWVYTWVYVTCLYVMNSVFMKTLTQRGTAIRAPRVVCAYISCNDEQFRFLVALRYFMHCCPYGYIHGYV